MQGEEVILRIMCFKITLQNGQEPLALSTQLVSKWCWILKAAKQKFVTALPTSQVSGVRSRIHNNEDDVAGLRLERKPCTFRLMHALNCDTCLVLQNRACCEHGMVTCCQFQSGVEKFLRVSCIFVQQLQWKMCCLFLYLQGKKFQRASLSVNEENKRLTPLVVRILIQDA